MALIEYAAPVAALVTALLVVWGVYALYTAKGDELRKRVNDAARTAHGRTRAAGSKPAAKTTSLFKDRSLSTFATVDRLMAGHGYVDRVGLDLARAAVPLRVAEYLLLRWAIGAGLFVLALLADMSWLAAIVLGLIGFFLPRFYVSRRERIRISKIEDQLVDALTLMSNALRSGSSFLQAMELVSRELPAPIAEEFGQVVAEAGVGAPLDQSLGDLAQRVRSYDVYLMVTAMTIQRSVGGNLSEVLEKIAHTIRERQRLLRQVQVETAEQRFSSYILLALPAGMAVLIAIINRPYIEPLLTESYGRLMLLGAVVLQIIGYLLMRKIADIKV